MALPERPSELDEKDYGLLLELARKTVRRRMSVPAIFFLESTKPLSYVGSQAMVFFGPFVRLLFESPNYYRYSEMLEDRDNLELLLRMIEELESEFTRAEDEARALRKAERRRPFWKFWDRNGS